MPGPRDQPARPERPGALLPLLNGVLATTFTFTFGVLGLIKNWRVPQLPHLFFGLLTSSAVSALLTAPLVSEWLGRRGRRTATPAVVKRPQFASPPAQQVRVDQVREILLAAASQKLFMATEGHFHLSTVSKSRSSTSGKCSHWPCPHQGSELS